MNNKIISIQPNMLYLVKVSAIKLQEKSPLEVSFNVKASARLSNTLITVDKELNCIIPTSSRILDERKEKELWYEQSLFLSSDALTNELKISLDTANQLLDLSIRITPVVIKPAERNVMVDTFQKMKNQFVKGNGKEYELFLNVDDAIKYVREFNNSLKNVSHPILNQKKIISLTPKSNMTIGCIGDAQLIGMLETTFNTVKILPGSVDLITLNVFNVILIQKRSTQFLEFGSTTEDEESFLNQLERALLQTSIPIVELAPYDDQNSIYSTLKPLKNCSIQEKIKVSELELCQFSPVNQNERSLLSVLVPNASDLYQFSEYMECVQNIVDFGLTLTIFEANYGHVPLRTWERFNSNKVKVYQTLTPVEISTLCSQSGFMVLSSESLRNIQDTVNLCSLAITNGVLPVVFGKALPSPIGQIVKNVYSWSELHDYIVTNSTALNHEREWLSSFRLLKRLQNKGQLITYLQSIAYNDFPILKERPQAEMICVTKRVHMIDNILSSFQRQSYQNLSLHLIWNVADEDKTQCKEIIKKYGNEKIKISILEQSYNIGNCLNYGIRNSSAEYWFKIDDDDYYGTHYIEDLVNWYETTDADVVGKPSAVMYLSQLNETILRGHALKQMRTFLPSNKYLCGATLSGRKNKALPMFSNYYRNSCDSKWIELLHEQDFTVFVGDLFNFMIHRGDVTQHTWQIEDEQLKNNASILAKTNLGEWMNA